MENTFLCNFLKNSKNSVVLSWVFLCHSFSFGKNYVKLYRGSLIQPALWLTFAISLSNIHREVFMPHLLWKSVFFLQFLIKSLTFFFRYPSIIFVFKNLTNTFVRWGSTEVLVKKCGTTFKSVVPPSSRLQSKAIGMKKLVFSIEI